MEDVFAVRCTCTHPVFFRQVLHASVLLHLDGLDSHGDVLPVPSVLPQMPRVPEVDEMLGLRGAASPWLGIRFVDHALPEPSAAHRHVQYQVELEPTYS